MLGIVYEDTAANAGRFMTREGATWPALSDPGGSVARAYRVTAIPDHVLRRPERHHPRRQLRSAPPGRPLAAYITQILQWQHAMTPIVAAIGAR